jgi:hypothetical protein
MPRKRGPGGPWVIVRAHYGALPLMAGRDWSERAKAFGIMAQASPRAGSTVPGSKKSPRRDAERRCRVPLFLGNPGNKPRPLPRCAFRRPVSPQSRGEKKIKAQLARRRENVSAWLFEIRIGKFSQDAATHAASYAGLTRVSILFARLVSKLMDARVKPAHDEERGWIAGSGPAMTSERSGHEPTLVQTAASPAS